MKKKWWQVVLKILYYGFTFTLGILIALVLPGINYEILTYESFNKYVETKEFKYALDLLGGIYNEEMLYQVDLSNGSTILFFETVSIYDEKNDEGNIEKSTFNESYSCFILNVTASDFVGKNNKSKILINDKYDINILHDSDGDGKNDSVSTLISSNFIYFTIDKTYVNKIENIKVLNIDGDVFYTINKTLEYSSDFFLTTQNFIKMYNEYLVDGFTEEESNELESEFYNKINKTNEMYKLSGSYVIDGLKKEANKEATIFVLIYFVWIYILGDFLVGKRYIWKFILFVSRKIKGKINKNKQKEVELSENFYSTINFKAKVFDDYESDIILSYEHQDNKDFNFKVILTKTKDFSNKARVHSGLYKLKDVSCNGKEVENLSEQLDVKGFFVDVSFEIKK